MGNRMSMLGVVAAGLLSLSAQAEVKVGVIAPRGELEAMTRWAEFGKYLGQEIGQPVTIVPLAAPKVVPTAKSGGVDFVLSQAAHTVVIQETLGGVPLATLNSPSGTQFAGVIVARKGSGITRAAQLKGRNVMGLDKSSAGAYIFQVHYLMQNGIDPKQLGSLKEGKKQDDLVLAVGGGFIDAAFVRTGALEQMEKEGKIKLSDFVVVDQKTDDGFAPLHTTPLYPEWYLVSNGKTTPELSQAVQAAVLKMKSDLPAARAAKIEGFVEPLPLDSMKQALQGLKLPPYAQ